jgi:hypothetical protein
VNLRTVAAAAVMLLSSLSLGMAQLNSQQAVQEKLEQEGYTGVHDVNFGPEAITAKANRNGKEWSLALDPYGKVIRQEAK